MSYLPQFLKKKLTTMPEPALRRLAHIAKRIALFSFASLPFLMGCIFYMVRPDISEALLRVFFATMLVGAMLLVFAELLKITKSSRQEELIDIILLSMMTFFFSILCVGIVSTVFFL